jgi:hypothetical protein
MPHGLRRIAVAACGLFVVGCGGTHGVPPSSTQSPVALTKDGVPISSDPVIGVGKPIVAPHQPREKPAGPLAFVLDAGSESVYEYDLARHRFLGPAPRVLDSHKQVVDLPGYPVSVGNQPPQQAVLCGDTLVVAGGGDGTVVAIPVSASGLGDPVTIKLPVVTVAKRSSLGHGTASSASRLGVPFVAYVAPIDGRHVLAVTQGALAAVAVGYLVDLQRHVVTAAAQLGDGDSNAAASYQGRAMVALGDGTVALADSQLDVTHAKLPTPAGTATWGLAASGQTAYLSTGVFSTHVGNAPSQLVSFVPAQTGQQVIATDSDPIGGTIALAGDTMVWARPDAPRTEQVNLATHSTTSWRTCAPDSVAAWRTQILATCTAPGEMDVVDTATGHVAKLFAGGFPVSVVVSPS